MLAAKSPTFLWKSFIGCISPGKGDKRKMSKGYLITQKRFCTAKEIINKIKRQPTEWENILTDTSAKGLISKIYKVLKNSTPKTKQPN